MFPTTTTAGTITEEQQLLVERIVASALFRKSHRLSAFLRYICEQHQQGKSESINEQSIGTAVFGRPVGYHVGEDSIVRSQARFLRQRLQEYFATEGLNETLTLTIPKGSYVPAFEPRDTAAPPEPIEEAAPVLQPASHAEPEPIKPKPAIWKRLEVKLALFALLLCVAGLFAWRLHLAGKPSAQAVVETKFWASIFDPQRTQIIVPADSSLILMEELSGVRVDPSDYMSRKYLDAIPPPGTDALWKAIRSSQYTNMADLNLVSRLERRPEAAAGKVQVRYARDLNLDELKETNAILIGGARANPWVSLYDSFSDFRVDYDWQTHTNFVRNQKPAAGEQERYDEVGNAGQHRAYGVIAYLPSLDGEGSALLVGGTSKAGTEAAADFLFNSSFAAFLRTLDAGGTLPHFEILLATQNLNGGSHHGEIVCFHRLPASH